MRRLEQFEWFVSLGAMISGFYQGAGREERLYGVSETGLSIDGSRDGFITLALPKSRSDVVLEFCFPILTSVYTRHHVSS